MTKYQETVDEIRGLVAAGDHLPIQELTTRAAEYVQACRDANDRLRKCIDSLRRNLRGDAIQLAEAEPNLLDLVALLDFPELPHWKVICTTHDLGAPPELLIELATALNEAYAAEEPMENLMAHHRLMALARAPLRERLMVMRRIAELDQSSIFWEEDIQKFELARLDEIRAPENCNKGRRCCCRCTFTRRGRGIRMANISAEGSLAIASRLRCTPERRKGDHPFAQSVAQIE